MLATEATETIAFGQAPTFSKDGKWLAYSIGVSEADREKAEKTKEAPKAKLGLRNLVSGDVATIDQVGSPTFSDDGKFLAMRGRPIKGRESAGADLVVRNLGTGIDTNFGNVSSFSFNEDGTLLAMIIDAEDKVGNGIQVYDAATGQLRTLESSQSKYTTLTWRKHSADLAALRENEHGKEEDASFIVLAWRGLGQNEPKKSVYDFAKDDKFPKNHRVVDFATLSWSDDGQTLFFGVKAWDHKPAEKPKKDESKKDDTKKPETKSETKRKALRDTLKEPAGVEVWHAKDIDIIPLQKKTAARKQRENFLAAYWLVDGKFVQLGNDLTEDVALVGGQKHALGMDNTPHETEKKFGPTLHDIYLIDVKTGDRKRVLDRLKYSLGSSPDCRYLLYVRDKNLWTYDISSGAHVNLTGAAGACRSSTRS